MNHPKTQQLFFSVRILASIYLSFSFATFILLVTLRSHPLIVTRPAWVYAAVVLCSGIVMTMLAFQMSAGHSRAYLMLRVVCAIMLATIAVIEIIPHDFPLWMKLGQTGCGIVLLVIAILINGKYLRSIFTAK